MMLPVLDWRHPGSRATTGSPKLPAPPSEASEFAGSGSTGPSTGRNLAVSSNRLISDGDSVARNAFRVGLRTDTPLPVAAAVGGPAARATLTLAPGGSAGITQELDPNDILEVQDMAAAIARAEMILASPTPPRTIASASATASATRTDIFETLGRRATDDTAGPATPAPPYAYASLPTPIPIPPALTPSAPRYLTMPSASEDDAFYQPSPRMRSLADVTLDGYRPEPTLLVRAASRRKRFSWLMVAALLPLMTLAAIAGFASTAGPESSARTTTTTTTSAATMARMARAPSTAATARTPLATSSALSKAPSRRTTATTTDVATAAPPAAGPPVFDVNSLPTARPGR
jgi:hypothetical protein